MSLRDLYVSRYMTKGMQLEFPPDIVSTSEKAWEDDMITWDQTSKVGVSLVTSPYYQDNKYVFAKYLTLSRVIEWIMIDSFRKQQ